MVEPATLTIEVLARKVSAIVSKDTGNILSDAQQAMVISRLKRRLIDLGGLSPETYSNYLQAHFEEEVKHLVGTLTTHHTYFFREFTHFEYIQDHLDEILARVQVRGDKTLKILSAACSRGHEVYSLAMYLDHLQRTFKLKFDYKIIGTDVDSLSIKYAKNGVFPYKEVIEIPRAYLAGHWQRGKGEIAQFARVRDELASHCSFELLNLKDTKDFFRNDKFDLILCRNVFIYLNQQMIVDVTAQFATLLHPGGILMTGLSESLKSLGIKVESLGPSIYAFNMQQSKPVKDSRVVQLPKPIRILCVDDSSTVIKVLHKVFASDPTFQIVGVASNGLEAEAFLKRNSVDAVTLDLHMPEMNGVEYLAKNFGPQHPPVVVVSSVSREDTRFAQKAFENGASDFVEKPALNNLTERADEIRTKIKSAILAQKTLPASFDKKFARSFEVLSPETKAIVLFGGFGELSKAAHLIEDLKSPAVPVLFVVEGGGSYLDVFRQSLAAKTLREVLLWDTQKLEVDKIYLCDLDRQAEDLYSMLQGRKLSIGILGNATQRALQFVKRSGTAQVLVEDVGEISKEIESVASDVFPWTSFSHVMTEFFAKQKAA